MLNTASTLPLLYVYIKLIINIKLYICIYIYYIYIYYVYILKICPPAGPTPETISDFWQMIWDVKLAVIVMLTKVDENGKVRPERSEWIFIFCSSTIATDLNFWRKIILHIL